MRHKKHAPENPETSELEILFLYKRENLKYTESVSYQILKNLQLSVLANYLLHRGLVYIQNSTE